MTYLRWYNGIHLPLLMHAGESASYEIRRSKRAKRVSFAVHWDGRCELVVPERLAGSQRLINRFVRAHAAWVVRQVRTQRRNAGRTPLTHRGVPVQLVTRRTRERVEACIRALSHGRAFEVQRIRIRSYKTRWGSCNADRTLCFHYKLALLPPELSEYVVAHELAHTVHLDHSKRFWALVEELCPDYAARRKALKNYLI